MFNAIHVLEYGSALRLQPRRAMFCLLIVVFSASCWRKAIQLTAGGDHTCGLRRDGVIVCWGRNDSGQCNVPSGTFTQVSAGSQHTCAVRKDGKILCWGSNSAGQSDAAVGPFKQVSASTDHTCALHMDGTLACWGSNEFGESTVPSGKFIDVASGDHHACAVGPDGSVNCWGDNRRLQCRPPVGKFRQVSAGRDHSCAIAADNTITCWGGWRAPDPPSEPGAKPVNDEPAYSKAYARAGSFAQVSSYGQGNCAIALDGSWHSWDIYFPNKGNTDGEPGDHCQVAGGTGHGCILKCNGEILCWGGWEYKQLLPPRFAFWPPGKACDAKNRQLGICD